MASDDFHSVGYIETRFSNIRCHGSERSILECDIQYSSLDEGRSCQQAGVICQGL